MADLTDLLVRLYRRLSRPRPGDAEGDGIPAVLDGRTAVALTEALVADTLAVAGAARVRGAALAWLSEQAQRGGNAFGQALQVREGDGPRGALATALGLAAAGRRAALFLDASELMQGLDLLREAARRQLPLVIQVRNDDAEALALAADAGPFVLLAADPQQAVDCTLLARRTAESALLPGLVVLDAPAASLIENLRLHPAASLRAYVGSAGELTATPTAAQRLLWGDRRRRLPRWHHLDRPLLYGARGDSLAEALGRAARRPYLVDHLPELLRDSSDALTAVTRRPLPPLAELRAKGARTLIVAQGAAAAQAREAARRLGRRGGVGVVTLQRLRPFPVAELRALLGDCRTLIVLERADLPQSADPPLTRELRALLAPAPGARAPVLVTALCANDGAPPRVADLVALCRREEAEPARVYLGVNFDQGDALHPKRQVMLDRLRRAYPQARALGLRGDPAPPAPDREALSLAIARAAGASRGLLLEAGALLHELVGGRIRARAEALPDPFAGGTIDHLVRHPVRVTPSMLNQPVGVALLLGGELRGPVATLALARNAWVVVTDVDDAAAAWVRLGPEARAAARRGELQLYRAAADSVHADDARLGALCGLLLAGGWLDATPRRLLELRERQLGGLDAGERRARSAAFRAALDAIVRLTPPAPGTIPETRWSDDAPLAVRHLGRNDDRFDSLPRFWDQVGVLYREAEQTALTADPYLAVPVVPPLASTFRDLSRMRLRLPRFDPSRCTACGDCWSRCPDGAIGALALTPAALLETAMRDGGDGLRPVASTLAQRLAWLGRSGDSAGADAGELLRDAFAWLDGQAPLAEPRRARAQAALDQAAARLEPLAVAFTEPLFTRPERRRRDSGSLLALAINPDACKGCGLCVAACDPGALVAIVDDAAVTERARARWRAWEVLPDTPAAVIEGLERDGGMAPLAALMLSRHCNLAVAGGDTAEPGSGEKLALRIALATAEHAQQPHFTRLIGELESARTRIGRRVRETLADALPAADLERLAAGLAQGGERALPLASLMERVQGSGAVDAARLKELIELARRLGESHWRIAEGHQRLGRARYGLVLADGPLTEWAGRFPLNPFQAPVTVDTSGDAAPLAAGICEGQLAEALETLALLRRAEADGSDGGWIADWGRLTADERRRCPTLFLAGNESTLGGRGLAGLMWLLRSGLPVKVLALADLDLGLDNRGVADAPLDGGRDPAVDLGLVALAQRDAYVAQCSLAAPEHYRSALREALDFPGPALVRVHAPSPGRHGFAAAAGFSQAEMALMTRTQQLFRYNPLSEGVFGLRLNLEGNPAPRTPWAEREGDPLTPAHWAVTEQRFAGHFRPLTTEDAQPLPLAVWLARDLHARAAATPVVAHPDDSEQSQWVVSPQMAAACDGRAHAWRMLQELAGLVTPFTARVEKEVEERLADGHSRALEELRQAHAQEMQVLRDGLQSEVHARIRERLLALAGYGLGSGEAAAPERVTR